jgi:hypothetical protein
VLIEVVRMPKIRVIAVRFLGTIAPGREPLFERSPMVGMLDWLHSLTADFDIIVACEDVPFSIAAAWLNDVELAWREVKKDRGENLPARMLTALVRFNRFPPHDCILVDHRALPWMDGDRYPSVDKVQGIAIQLQEA